MAEICNNCKELAYDPEDQVCKACGNVPEEINFGPVNYSTYEPGTSSRQVRKKKRVALGLKYGMDVLCSLSNKYSISSSRRGEVADLLEKIHSKKSFRLKQDLGVMAGCCLIHVNRRYDCFIPISDLCSKLSCTKKSVSKCFKIINLVSKELGRPSVLEEKNEVVRSESFVNLQALESSIRLAVDKAPDDSKELLTEKTTALVKLAFSLWLGTGRSMEGLVAAATYLCFKSMDPSRRTLSYASFHKKFNLPDNKALIKISELTEMLLKLGEKIPSVTKNYVNKSNILFHLDYILKNSTTLRNDIHSGEFDLEEISKKDFSMFRKKPPVSAKRVNIETDTYDPDMCASDIEISDAEISSYIRTEEQVKAIKALRDINKPKEESIE